MNDFYIDSIPGLKTPAHIRWGSQRDNIDNLSG
jgi:hypothetical protein